MGETSTGWADLAACRGTHTDDWFPLGQGGRGPMSDTNSMEIAKARECYERRCPVIEDCLAYAVALNIRHGVWGGRTSNQRKRLRTAWVRARRAHAS